LVLGAAIAASAAAASSQQTATPAQPVAAAADARLQPLRTLDTHCPFHPPATPETWKARAADLRRQLQVALGLWPWPERTPLNARVQNSATRDGYIVEAVVIESLPGHFVTGSLYRPTGRAERLPAVLSPHGHWPGGRFQDIERADVAKAVASGAEPIEVSARHPLQARAVHLARLGAVVFLFDLEGYADSVQIPSAVAHGFKAERPHMHGRERWGFFSPQAELRLQSIMGLQTWNAMRALDYLASRDDVDPARIGVTGASGGGTQTFILAALDSRPAAFFPAVMVSTGMQGGCTCENANYLRIGTGNVEIAALAAPKPLGLTAADDWTREMERDGFPELQRVFALVAAPDRVRLWPFLQFPHNYNAPARAAMYEWFNQHLRLGHDRVPAERPFEPLTRAEATVWTTTHPAPAGGDDHERDLLQQMTRRSQDALSALVPKIRTDMPRYRTIVGGAFSVLLGGPLPSDEAIGFEQERSDSIEGGAAAFGRLRRPSTGAALPAVLLTRNAQTRGVLVWVSPAGKASLFAGGAPVPGVIEAWQARFDVLGVDVLGQGELQSPHLTGDRLRLVSERPYAGYTFGYNRPLPAERVQDMLTAIRFARQRARGGEVLVMADGAAAAWAAGARALAGPEVTRAALDLGGFRFGQVDAIDSPDFLPGAVKYGDVPALLALSTPAALWVRDRSPDDLEITRRIYAVAGAQNGLRIAGDGESPLPWLFR
jgi:dienelactone hydrolase